MGRTSTYKTQKYPLMSKDNFEWKISLQEHDKHTNITVNYGPKGTKGRTLVTKITDVGKGGKKRSISHWEQAEKEAQSRINRKIRDGYSDPKKKNGKNGNAGRPSSKSK